VVVVVVVVVVVAAVVANVLNNKSQTAGKGWSTSLGTRRKVGKPSPN
jgi:hypothetical protein